MIFDDLIFRYDLYPITIFWKIKSLILWEISYERWFWTIQKSKCTVSIGVGGQQCVWILFCKHSKYQFCFISNSDIVWKFMQSQGLLMHPQITPYRSFNFTRDLLVPLFSQLRRSNEIHGGSNCAKYHLIIFLSIIYKRKLENCILRNT